MNTDELRTCGVTGKDVSLPVCQRCRWYSGGFSAPDHRVIFDCRHPLTVKLELPKGESLEILEDVEV